MKGNFIIGLMICITLLILGIFLITNTQEFSQDNIGWNGSSEFFSRLDRHTTEMITHIPALEMKENATLLIIAPNGTWSDEEMRIIRTFLQNGNTVFLADETDAGNSLLSGLGSSIRIGSSYLSGIDRAYNNSAILITSPVQEHSLTSGVGSLVLDKAKPLTGGTPLIQTSIMSWIDTNNDFRISSDESFGRYTVLAHEQIGKGEIIVLSDSGVFINSMSGVESEYGNGQFLSRCIQYRPILLIEQIHSRTADQSGSGWLLRYIRLDSFIKTMIVLVSLLACVFLFRKRPPGFADIGSEPVMM
ncbi:DUF4350 domain-containing protein [Methanospirillum hungatei]|uniref:DUF4350 domain-containing protein n=1 Tax=Methanospirillum hungatei TaxID=2203 RepID=UPI0026EFEE74|nr:DUF4350 domain-containing protein [Methanospirillum hungatei]MCA1917023.1 DUF4350 domain-containing protein [Methanospirillum hungatei]